MIGNPAPGTGLLPGAPEEVPPSARPPAPLPVSRPRSRVPLLVVVAAGVIVLGAVSGFVLLNNSGGDEPGGPIGARTGRTTAPTASASATASTAVAPVPTGRNPFMAPAGTGITFSPGPSGTSTGTAGSPAAGGSVAPSAATTTVTADPTYVGLYALSSSRATFWVNDAKYQVSVGGTFAGFTYAAKTSSTCVRLTRDGENTTICVGTVEQFPT